MNATEALRLLLSILYGAASLALVASWLMLYALHRKIMLRNGDSQ